MDKPPTRRERAEEAYLLEWVEMGLAELARYLARWASFDEWCREHEREEIR